MATTTNYGWETPDDTDLVKDGAAAIRTLGSSIDTTTKNLNPETTTGDIAYRSATANTNTRLAIGTNGQVLTVAAGVPSWATPTSGGMTLLSTTTLSGSSTTVSSISGSYIDLIVYLANFDPTADCTVAFRLNGDTGSNYYNFGNSGNGQNGSGDTSAPFLNNVESTGTGDSNAAYIHLPQYSNTTTKKYARSYGTYAHTNASDIGSGAWQFFYNSTSAINSITLIPNSTTWNGGTIYIYGVK